MTSKIQTLDNIIRIAGDGTFSVDERLEYIQGAIETATKHQAAREAFLTMLKTHFDAVRVISPKQFNGSLTAPFAYGHICNIFSVNLADGGSLQDTLNTYDEIHPVQVTGIWNGSTATTIQWRINKS